MAMRDRSRTPRGATVADQGTTECPMSTSEILQVIHDREKARHSKDFATADSLRTELQTNGVTIWDKKGNWTTSDGRSGMIPTFAEVEGGDMQAAPIDMGNEETAWIRNLVLQREQARAQKNFAESDRIRDELKQQGVEIYDKEKTWKQESTGLQGCVLGYGQAGKGPTDTEINTLIIEREKAREHKDFPKSDMIRDELKAQGVIILDKEKRWKSRDGRSGAVPSFDIIKASGGRPALAKGGAIAGLPGAVGGMDLSQTILNAAMVGQQSPMLAQQTLQLLAQIATQAAGGASPVIGGAMSPSIPAAARMTAGSVGVGSSPDMQKALQVMRQYKQSRRQVSDSDVMWFLSTREKMRAAKDFKGSDSMREALRSEVGIVLFEKEKRWQSNDGRGGAIPSWSELGIGA
eukprot:TRINITY_DN782_c0_g2_i1.p1 TRINITY_DN782_c0_g2~~TRINITY_DN782_c0_g2_i1.p1  ORF type:complete len:406 (+),score=120.54 TRINITY_DN782_c0_g2_i1:78-1295(+)